MFKFSKLFKLVFWVPYEDSTTYPTIKKAHQAIGEYCEKNGFSYEFPNDDTVIIDGKEHEICRGFQIGCRGNYGIKCREK